MADTAMQVEKTSRGFEIVRFDDANGVPCSLQQSSAILGEEPTAVERPGSSGLWLGTHPDQSAAMPLLNQLAAGVVPSPLATRMHLDRDHVRKLVDRLQRWLATGTLSGAGDPIEAADV